YASFSLLARAAVYQRKTRATVQTATSPATNARIRARVTSLSISQLYIVSPADDADAGHDEREARLSRDSITPAFANCVGELAANLCPPRLCVNFPGLVICSASIWTAVRSVDNARLGGGFHSVADAAGSAVVVM